MTYFEHSSLDRHEIDLDQTMEFFLNGAEHPLNSANSGKLIITEA